MKTHAKRLLALLCVAALIVLLRPGGIDAAGWLRAMLWHLPPGVLTVTTRPDLSSFGPPTDSYASPDNRFVPDRFEFAGQLRQFYALPAHAGEGRPPLVILLHGSGRDGRAMLDMWSEIAAKGAFLLAPDALESSAWNTATDGPDFLSALVEEAYKIQPFDRERIYFYGHSAGASMALYLGNCTDFPARAIAIHAGVLPDCPALSALILRPYLIQIGDRDAAFPLSAVHETAEQIAEWGNPVTLQVIPGHDHWYYDIGPALADEAWEFFQKG
jgi:predicted esterase